MAWPVPTSGEAMVSLKGRYGGSRARRYGRRPFRRRGTVNKFNTFWVPLADADETEQVKVFRTDHLTSKARNWVSLRHDKFHFSPFGVASDWSVDVQVDDGGHYSLARKNLRILRWDGAVHLDVSGIPADVDTAEDKHGVFTESWLWYFWMMQKREPMDGSRGDDDVYTTEEARWNIRPMAETHHELLRRRDLRHHGVVKVLGSRMRYDELGGTMYTQQERDSVGRAVLPMPRIPRGGLVIKPGEELSLWVASTPCVSGFMNPMDGNHFVNGAVHRPVVGLISMRALCSLD